MSKFCDALVASLTLGVTSCTSLPKGHIYSGEGYQAESYTPEGMKKGGRGAPTREGRDFCRHVEDTSRTHSVELMASGWATGIASVVAVGAGAILTATTPDNASDWRKAGNASLPLLGAVFGYYSFGEFSREKDVAEIGAIAAQALNEPDDKDRDANAACNKALGYWSTTRPASNAALTSAMPGPKDSDDGRSAKPEDVSTPSTSGANTGTPAPTPAGKPGR